MVPQIECSWMRGWGWGVEKVGSERGRDGWAAFPGLSCYLSRCKNVYTQRLPHGPEMACADWQQAEANESEFLLGVAAIPPWDSHHRLPRPSYLYHSTPRHTASSVTVRYACAGLPGSSWPSENERGCLPSFENLLKLD